MISEKVSEVAASPAINALTLLQQAAAGASKGVASTTAQQQEAASNQKAAVVGGFEADAAGIAAQFNQQDVIAQVRAEALRQGGGMPNDPNSQIARMAVESAKAGEELLYQTQRLDSLAADNSFMGILTAALVQPTIASKANAAIERKAVMDTAQRNTIAAAQNRSEAVLATMPATSEAERRAALDKISYKAAEQVSIIDQQMAKTQQDSILTTLNIAKVSTDAEVAKLHARAAEIQTSLAARSGAAQPSAEEQEMFYRNIAVANKLTHADGSPNLDQAKMQYEHAYKLGDKEAALVLEHIGWTGRVAKPGDLRTITMFRDQSKIQADPTSRLSEQLATEAIKTFGGRSESEAKDAFIAQNKDRFLVSSMAEVATRKDAAKLLERINKEFYRSSQGALVLPEVAATPEVTLGTMPALAKQLSPGIRDQLLATKGDLNIGIEAITQRAAEGTLNPVVAANNIVAIGKAIQQRQAENAGAWHGAGLQVPEQVMVSLPGGVDKWGATLPAKLVDISDSVEYNKYLLTRQLAATGVKRQQANAVRAGASTEQSFLYSNQ